MCNKAKEHFREVFKLQANVHFLDFTGMSVCVHLSWAYRSTNFHPQTNETISQIREQKVCCCSVAKLCLTLCNPMDCSTPDFPIFHYLLELTQTHVHWVSDAIQPSHPLLLLPSIFPSIRVFSNESVLHIRWTQYWSFSFNISPSNEHSGWSPLGWTGWISLQSKGLSRVFSNTTVQKHQFFCAQLSL